jgi:hypothetical protein
MNKFVYDMIHMTEGEKFTAYWWLWLAIFLIGLIAMVGTQPPWRRR